MLRHGWQMPATDPYSHTMPDRLWVEHAWLTDGLLGLIYSMLGSAGPLGVILFFAAVTVAACLAAAGSSRADRTSKLLVIAAVLWVARPFLGARTQLITLLGLATVLWLWHRVQAGRPAWLWAIPPLFLLWANLHGGFTAGLLLLIVILIVSVAMRLAVTRRPTLEQRLNEPVLGWSMIGHLALVIGVSALVTLVNPYGWQLHQEIYQSLSDRFMLETLYEWQPLSLQTHAGRLFVEYLAAWGLLVLVCYRRIEPVRWVILAVFLAFSIRHWRNIPFFLLVSLPLSAELLADAASRLTRYLPGAVEHQKRWLLAVTVAATIMVGLLGPEHLQHVARSGLVPEAFFQETDYPIEAVRWVKAHRDRVGTRLFNEYGHGGFLLWWLPEEKIFIDGRMPAWRIGDRRIFEDYLALTNWDPPALGVLDKYGVDWALVSQKSSLAQALGNQSRWRRVYEDATAVIYVRRL